MVPSSFWLHFPHYIQWNFMEVLSLQNSESSCMWKNAWDGNSFFHPTHGIQDTERKGSKIKLLLKGATSLSSGLSDLWAVGIALWRCTHPLEISAFWVPGKMLWFSLAIKGTHVVEIWLCELTPSFGLTKMFLLRNIQSKPNGSFRNLGSFFLRERVTRELAGGRC